MTKHVAFYSAIAALAISCNNSDVLTTSNENTSKAITSHAVVTDTIAVESPRATEDFAYQYFEPGNGKRLSENSWEEVATDYPDDEAAPQRIEEIHPQADIVVKDENSELSASVMRLTKLLEPAKQQLQTFVLTGDSATVIQGNKGAKIYLDPAKLVTLDGQPYTGKIVVELVELQSTVDMLFAGTPTVSDGKLLESGGSYYINCKTTTGESLKIKEGQSLAMELPHVGKDSMQLFVGEQQAKGDMNWKATDDTVVSIRKPAYYIAMDYYKRTAKKRHYEKATHEMVLEAKAFDENEWREVSRYKLTNWQRLTLKKRKKATITYDDFSYSSTVPIDSSFSYKKMSTGSIFSKYRSIAKAKSGGIRPTTDPTNATYAQSKNVATTLHQIDNRLSMQNLYYTQINGFGWINCDRLYGPGPRTTLYVKISDKAPSNNTTAYMSYILFKSIKGLLAGYKIDSNKEEKIAFEEIPSGMDVVLVVLCEKDGKILADISDLTITKKETEYIPNFKVLSSANEVRARVEAMANGTVSSKP